MKDVPLYTGDEVYRPFWEDDSALLEVSLGCSWHGCRFCDFACDSFHLFSVEEIEEKAKKLVPYAQGKKRLFLLGDNPFVLDTPKLLAVFDIVERYLPWIEEISMYARFDDVLRKAPQELGILRRKGLVHLHIGMESGCDPLLKWMNKGTDAGQARQACNLLHDAGITFSVSVIPGLGGKKLTEAHAKDTAALLNDTQPERLWLIGLKVWPNTPLAAMCETGEFVPLTPRERLLEIRCMMEDLELAGCAFAATTVLDQYTLMGRLPEHKKTFLSQMDDLLAHSQG